MVVDAEIKLVLDRRSSSQRKNGTFPIQLDVNHKGMNRRIRLGRNMAVLEKHWNAKSNKLRTTAPDYNTLSQQCADSVDLARDVIRFNRHLLESLTVQQLVKLIKEALKDPSHARESIAEADVPLVTSDSITLKQWAEVIINRSKKADKISTANWYKEGVSALLKFYGNNSLALDDITKTLLEDFKAWHLQKAENDADRRKKMGGLNAYLRAIRALLNKAVAEDKMLEQKNPFNGPSVSIKKVKIHKPKPAKRAVDSAIVRDFIRLYRGETVKGLSIKRGSHEWIIISEALFMWESYSMNFIDLVKFRIKDFNPHLITYQRSKTGREVQFIPSPLALEIGMHFKTHRYLSFDFYYLFRYGFMSGQQGYERYKSQRRRWNENMTKIASRIGYENVRFTTYVMRHTFATSLNKNGVQRDKIGQMFGHADGRSIDTYCDKEDITSLDQMARNALSAALGD